MSMLVEIRNIEKRMTELYQEKLNAGNYEHYEQISEQYNYLKKRHSRMVQQYRKQQKNHSPMLVDPYENPNYNS